MSDTLTEKYIISHENLGNGFDFNETTKVVTPKVSSDDKIITVDENGIKANLDLTFDTDTRELVLKGKDDSSEIVNVSLNTLHYEGGNGINIDGSNKVAIDDGVVVTHTDLTNTINGLDVTDSAVDKQLVSSVSESDGKISVLRRALVKEDIPTIEQSQVNGLPDKITQCDNNKSAIDTLNGNALTSGSVANSIATAVAAMNMTKEISGTDIISKFSLTNGTISVETKTLTKSDLELGNVDNTSDADKPVSTAQKTAIQDCHDEAVEDAATLDVALHSVIDAETDTKISSLDAAKVTVETGKIFDSIEQVDGVIYTTTKALTADDIPALAISKVTDLQTKLDEKLDKSGGTLTGDLTLDGDIVSNGHDVKIVEGNYFQSNTNDETKVANLSAKNSFLQAEIAYNSAGTPYGDTPYSCTGCKGWCIIGISTANKTLTLRGDCSNLDSYKGTTSAFSIAIGEVHSSKFGTITNIVKNGTTSAVVTFSSLPDISRYESYTQTQFEDLFVNDDNALYLATKPDLGIEIIKNFYAQHAEGGSVKAIGKYSHAEGRDCISDGRYSHSQGSHNFSGGMASFTSGFNNEALGGNAIALGQRAISKNEHNTSFVWNSSSNSGTYYSKANNSFCINPQGGTDGFYIGDSSLTSIIQNKSAAKFSDTDKADLSSDDGIVLAIKAILLKMGMKESNITMP